MNHPTIRIAMLAATLTAAPAVALAVESGPAGPGAERMGLLAQAADPGGAAAEVQRRERARMDQTLAGSEAALKKARESGDKAAEADALATLGPAYLLSGRADEGLDALRASADLYDQVGDEASAQRMRKLVAVLEQRQAAQPAP